MLPIQIRRNFSRLAGLLEIADKEFVEIRSLLLSYEKETMKTLRSESKNEDVEIDAILLNKLTEINADIMDINSHIEAIIGINFAETIRPDDYERIIKQLHWFGINTLNQLYDFIARNCRYAIKIAKELLVPLDSVNKGEKIVIFRTIAFFYLCYAELITNTKEYEFDSFVQYFEEMNIDGINESRKEAASSLFRLREKLHISD